LLPWLGFLPFQSSNLPLILQLSKFSGSLSCLGFGIFNFPPLFIYPEVPFFFRPRVPEAPSPRIEASPL
jgi:hypothetical protein